MSYDERFFESIRDGCQRSAETVVPLILDEVEPRSVIDVGCGEGWWGLQFQIAGCHVVGLDGAEILDRVLDRRIVDLARPFGCPGEHFDLAVSLEVAEHLPPERAEGFVADLCSLAPAVVFSAAVPGQGGTDHLNEQWQHYWVGLFANRGYQPDLRLRRRIWNYSQVEWWYRQNIIVFTADPDAPPTGNDFDVVHPEMLRHHGWA